MMGGTCQGDSLGLGWVVMRVEGMIAKGLLKLGVDREIGRLAVAILELSA